MLFFGFELFIDYCRSLHIGTSLNVYFVYFRIFFLAHSRRRTEGSNASRPDQVSLMFPRRCPRPFTLPNGLDSLACRSLSHDAGAD
jgi:hypothetical protein